MQMAIEEAKKKGSGVIALGAKMIDRPVVLKAEKVLETARAAEIPIPTPAELLASEPVKMKKSGGGDD